MGSFKKYNVKKDFGTATHKLELKYPGVGLTGEFLMIRSQYSAQFREAIAEAKRQIATLTIANKGAKLDDDVAKDIELQQYFSLVESWSFDEELTIENFSECIGDNPQWLELINETAASDTLFLSSNVTD